MSWSIPCYKRPHGKRLLRKLLEIYLYIKGEKYDFHVQQVSFLGYIISMEGVVIDQSKVTAVSEWSALTTIKELK